MTADTIFALSSGRPPAAVAVVRVSGPGAGEALRSLVRAMPAERQATLARLRDPADGEAIDDALVLWFPAPRSETGEDLVEFQLHGGRAVVAALTAALGRLPGLRPAEPGEFARRAFAHGKLDLTRIEGLADLIGAETEAQRRQAFRQLKGLLGNTAETWRAQLIEAMALVEAAIDFPDDDVPADLLTPALAVAENLRNQIYALLADGRRGERLRDGLRVAVAGPVNVGKSSLLNRIAKRPAAIVSPFAGTTRDIIEVHLDLDGYPVTLLDTAGLRDSEDPVEREGVRRAREQTAAADLVLWVVDATDSDATDSDPPAPPAQKGGQEGAVVWLVVNKCDLLDEPKYSHLADRPHCQAGPGDSSHKLVSRGGLFSDQGCGRRYRVSALTGASIDALLAAIAVFAAQFFAVPETAAITRERHRSALRACAEALDRAVAEGASGGEEIIAEELRLAATALGRLTGRVDVEDILDAVFGEFCIGK